MSTLVDENNPRIDSEAEVKKLQDLVKKLERQNQILRNKQNDNSDVESDPSYTKQNRSRNNAQDTENLKDSLRNISLEDVELLDVHNAMSDEDDSWLYSSPKRPSAQQKSVSPYKWVRQEFEHPSPDVEQVKRSLLFKLDEVSRVSRSSSSGTLASLTSPTGPTMLLPGEVPHHAHHPVNSQSMPSIRQPIVTGLGTRIDTGTFTRPKRSKMKLANRNHIDFYVGSDKDSSNEQLNSDLELRDMRDDDFKDSDEDIVHKLSDVVDVQVLARMQEESLRQSYNSPIASPRKSLAKSFNATGLRSLRYQDNDSPSSQSSTRSSPGRCEGDQYHGMRQSSNSLASASSHSNTSSPPDSPYGSQYLDPKPNMSEPHRRSLPNLNTGRLSLPQNHSEPQLAKESPPRTTTGLRQPRAPGSGARTASPGRALSPGRTLSPLRSGIPGPKTGIPRPGSASKLRPPRKSSIPSPRRPLVPKVGIDDSWKDGCF